MPNLLRRSAWLLTVACLTGCAPTRPPAALPDTTVADADAKVRDGCYDCLLEARERYRSIAKGQSWPTIVRRLFEVELLIAMRERELGLDPSAAIASASEIGQELPATIPVDRYLADVQSLSHERHGWPRRELAVYRQTRGLSPARAREEAAWIRQGPLTGPFAEYLAISIECSHDPRPAPAAPASGAGAPPATPEPEAAEARPPIVQYRIATCGAPQRGSLEVLRTTVPGFVETSLFLGQIAVAQIAEGGAGDPHALAAETLRRFPDSPAATFLGATLQRVVADFDRAIELYDRTLALKPLHEDAWLGRTVSLTELERREEAIDASTRMIVLELDNVDEALYWRAWNYHARGDLAKARADIDEARRRRRSDAVLTLAGIIEHDQDELDAAGRDLREALRIGQGRNCRADWYLGSVLVKQRQWKEAAPTFEAAMTCYGLDVRSREEAIRRLEQNAGIDPVFKRSRIDRLRGEIQIQHRQQLAAAFNAASNFALSGDLDRARPFIDVAAGDPDLVDEIDELQRHMAAVAAARRAGGS